MSDTLRLVEPICHPAIFPPSANPPADHYLAALIAQSRALNTLVVHLHTSQTDPMAELTAGGQGMGIKGAAGREKLQGLGIPDSPILPEGLPKHPQTNGPLRPCSHDHGGGKRDFPGEVRRFWPEHRTRPDDVGFGAYLQPRVEGKPGRCARSRCTISSDVGAGFTGWRTVASGMVARITGRSTPKSMAQQDPSRHGGRRLFGALCAQSWATIAVAFKGDGDSLQQEVRGHRSEEPAQPRGESRRSTAEAKAKKAPRRRRRPEQHTTAQPAGTRRTGVAGGSSSQHVSYSKRGDNVPFLKSMQAKFKDLAPAPQKTSNIASFSFTFSAWCFSIIRWVLATRTDFGRYLASALCLRRDGPESSPTALFPLPLPSFHPAAPVDPELSRGKRFEKMLDRPLLVVICALNYAYCARFTFPLELLRRQPNRLQQNAIDRLRLLIGASDPVPQLKSHPVEERIWS